jgi:1-acyl-sn-glycerol-3-phosphate acyltransferase
MILPVAIHGTDRILPRDAWVPRIGRRARIRFGPPMDLSRYYVQPDGIETSHRIVDAVMAEIARLQAML